MKIELSTKKGDFSIELSTETERLKFANKVPSLITERDFISADMVEDEGSARFTTLAGLIKALINYEDSLL